MLCNILPQLQWLKTTHIYHFCFHGLDIWTWFSCVLCFVVSSGCNADIDGAAVSSDARLGNDQFMSSLQLLENPFPGS